MRFPSLLQAHLVSWCHFSTEFHTHLVASVLVYLAVVVNMYSNVSSCSHFDLFLYFIWQKWSVVDVSKDRAVTCHSRRHQVGPGVTSSTLKTSLCRMWSTCNLLIHFLFFNQGRHHIATYRLSSDSKRLILFLLSSVFTPHHHRHVPSSLPPLAHHHHFHHSAHHTHLSHHAHH